MKFDEIFYYWDRLGFSELNIDILFASNYYLLVCSNLSNIYLLAFAWHPSPTCTSSLLALKFY